MSQSATASIDTEKWKAADKIMPGGYTGNGRRTYMWKDVEASFRQPGKVDYESTGLSEGQWTVPDGMEIYFPEGGELKRW